MHLSDPLWTFWGRAVGRLGQAVAREAPHTANSRLFCCLPLLGDVVVAQRRPSKSGGRVLRNNKKRFAC